MSTRSDFTDHLVNKTLTEMCSEFRNHIHKTNPSAIFDNNATNKRKRLNFNENLNTSDATVISGTPNKQACYSISSLLSPNVSVVSGQSSQFSQFNYVTASNNLINDLYNLFS